MIIIKYIFFIFVAFYSFALSKNFSSAGARDCRTKTYISDKKWTPEYLFDNRENIAWDVASDYGIQFHRILHQSGIECLELEEDTICGHVKNNFMDNYISIKIVGHQPITIGDGSVIETIASDIIRASNTTRVFHSANGDIIGFSSYVEGHGLTQFVTCDQTGAIHLQGLDE